MKREREHTYHSLRTGQAVTLRIGGEELPGKVTKKEGGDAYHLRLRIDFVKDGKPTFVRPVFCRNLGRFIGWVKVLKNR